MITPTHSSVLFFPFVLCPHSNHSCTVPLAVFISLSFNFCTAALHCFPFFWLLLLQFLLPSGLSHQYFSNPSHLPVQSDPFNSHSVSQTQSILQSVVGSIRPTAGAVLQNVSQSESCPCGQTSVSPSPWLRHRMAPPTPNPPHLVFPAQQTHHL